MIKNLTRFKSFSVALMVACALLSPVAEALPGQSVTDLKKWVKNHAFLSPYLEGPIFYMGDEEAFIGFRQIDREHFLDVVFPYFQEPGKSLEVMANELKLVKREYQAELRPDYGDKRPWKDIAVVNIWRRENPTAYQFLSKVYSKAIADDFKNSQLWFEGPEYTIEYPGTYYRHKIEGLDYRIFAWVPEVRIYQGKRFTYEVSAMDYFGARHEGMSLKILPLREGQLITATLQHNRKQYELFKAKELEKTRRLTPAEIKIVPENQ